MVLASASLDGEIKMFPDAVPTRPKNGLVKNLLLAGLTALLLSLNVPAKAEQSVSLEISRPGVIRQHQTVPFHLNAFDRREITSEGVLRGYSPSTSAPSRWMGPVTIEWDFGDGTQPVPTNERLSALHRYKQPGTYTLTVTASDVKGQYGTGTRQVVVENQPPNLMMAVSPTLGVTQSFDFHAANIVVRENPGETLYYEWDFGDGNSRKGQELSKVSHRYRDAGKYTVVVKATDLHGDSDKYTKKVRIRAPGQDAKPSSPGDGKLPEKVLTEFTGSMSGTFSANLDADIDVIANGAFHYLVAKKGGICRLKFSFDDQASGITGYVSLSLRGLTSRGARYKINNPRIMMSFENPDLVLRTQDGTLELVVIPGKYVTGRVEARLRHYKRTGEGLKPQADFVDLKGDFGIDLQAHQQSELIRDPAPSTNQDDQQKRQQAINMIQRSIFRQPDCTTKFTVTDQWPRDYTEHLPHARPAIRVNFSADIDPNTVTKETFQVGYPDEDGRFVPAKGKLLVKTKSVAFVPNRALRAGVHYTAQVKTGERGVTSATGEPIETSSDEDWHRWRFSTAIDFAGTAHKRNGLFCHIYQSSRDVPLIAGKPAVARVYAQWSGHKDVLPEAQVRDFLGHVSVGSQSNPLGTTQRQFFRPDLYSDFNIDKSKAQHTAQVPFVPIHKMGGLQLVTVSVGESLYVSACPSKIWDHQSKPLTVDVYRLSSDDETMAVDAALAKRFVKDVKVYAWQLLPFKEIVINGPFEIAAPELLPKNDALGASTFSKGYKNTTNLGNQQLGALPVVTFTFPGYFELLTKKSKSADIIVVLGPHRLFRGGANTWKTLVKSKQGFVASTLGSDEKYYSRYVNGVVHEFGHVLLGSGHHIPDPGESEEIRDAITRLRVSNLPLHFKGIEGYRMNPDGSSGANMSSVEGNALANSLAPLMFPGTMPRNSAFIMNHHYRKIQRNTEKR